MANFATALLPAAGVVIAPDGSQVRPMLSLERGSMAQFQLAAGRVARAVKHQTVDEIWFVTAGAGEIWRSLHGREENVPLDPGTCITIPAGTAFQFRAAKMGLTIIGVTMPAWPGDSEAVPVTGPWTPTV